MLSECDLLRPADDDVDDDKDNGDKNDGSQLVELLIFSKCYLLRGNKSDGAECHVAVRTCLGKKTINKMLEAGGTVFFIKFIHLLKMIFVIV